jgi:hypothetical protein
VGKQIISKKSFDTKADALKAAALALVKGLIR